MLLFRINFIKILNPAVDTIEDRFGKTSDLGLSGGTLLFPQVFQARSDGGFFLGSAGELWCFDEEGSVRWRLTQFNAGHRQGLPAFYRVAGAGADSSFFILDPLGNRILKFVEDSIDSKLA